ncbi:YfiR family protein [Fulvivirga aurantia]|uniref:YfiR family protein n=1 Tax=Fulvivirga aurantia TaxID=2529383 RepID=UPI0016263EE7|nr:YfiR family protein [Fulvivirga aurantia]
MALICLSNLGYSQNTAGNEKVKSLFLLSLTRHVEWPSAKKSLTIGLLGEDHHLQQNLKKLATERKCSKKINITTFTSAFDVKNCDILFVTNQGIEEALLLDEQLAKNTLVVTDSDIGQALAIVNKNGRLSFQVNEVAMAKTNFKLSSDMLALATLTK